LPPWHLDTVILRGSAPDRKCEPCGAERAGHLRMTTWKSAVPGTTIWKRASPWGARRCTMR